MKSTILITTTGLGALLSSCAPLGIYSGNYVYQQNQKARELGIQEGKAIATRAAHMQAQAKLEKPQPQFKYYSIPVEGHTDASGIKFEAHTKTVEIVTQ